MCNFSPESTGSDYVSGRVSLGKRRLSLAAAQPVKKPHRQPAFLQRSLVSMALTVWWRLLFTSSKEPFSYTGCKAECSSFFLFFFSSRDHGERQKEAACISTLVLAACKTWATLLLDHLLLGPGLGMSPQATRAPFLPSSSVLLSKLLLAMT